MAVTSDKSQVMLECERCNPQIILRNGSTAVSQQGFEATIPFSSPRAMLGRYTRTFEATLRVMRGSPPNRPMTIFVSSKYLPTVAIDALTICVDDLRDFF